MASLHEKHQTYLRDRGVDHDVASERGYYSIASADDLPPGEWTASQRSQLKSYGAPRGALVIPIHGQADYGAVLHQLRMDHPREDNNGSMIKFELPIGATRGTGEGKLPADVHPSIIDALNAPDVWDVLSGEEEDLWVVERQVTDADELEAWVAAHPDPAAAQAEADQLDHVGTVIITEGVVKGDSILSAARREGLHRIFPVSVTGVDMAVHEGRLVESLAWLDDRFEVVIAFDADWADNDNVARALGTLRDALEAKGFQPTLIDLNPHRRGRTDGIDDVLASGVSLAKLLDSARPVHFSVPYPGLMTGESADSGLVPADGSDLSVASRVVHVASGRDPLKALRFDTSTATWLRWDGCRWTPDTGGQLANQIVRTFTEDMVRTLQASGETSKTTLHSLRSAAKRRHALELARVEEPMVVDTTTWVLPPTLLATPAGVVDLTNGKVRKASPSDPILATTRVPYRPGVRSDLWDRFLDDTFGGDAELITYVQQVAGACATGHPVEVLFWMYGLGCDGKSTLTGALEWVLGDYAITLDPEALLGAQSNTTEYSRAQLRGRRYLRLAEARHYLDAVLLKRVASVDPVVGRRAYGSPESFDPTHTAVATSNRLPKFSRNDANRGTARRVRIIPFNHPVPQDRIDLRLGQQLRETDHAEAVLAWVVEGAIALQASKGTLPPCAAVEEATTEALDQLFVIRQWADEHLIFEPGHELDLVEVATTFRAWINQQGGESRETNNTIGAALTGPDQAAGLRKSNGKRLITGVRWNPAGAEAAALAATAK